MGDIILLAWIGLGISLVLVFLFRMHKPLGVVLTIAMCVPGAIVGAYLSSYIDVSGLRQIDLFDVFITTVSTIMVLLAVSIIRK